MFYDIHAIIMIFGGSIAATLIRFPLAAMLHGLPLGIKFAFTMSDTIAARTGRRTRRASPRSRASRAPSGWRRSRPRIRSSPRASALSRTATTPISSATTWSATATTSSRTSTKDSKIYRAIGDCAPAFGMIGTLIGMVQMFANMSDPSKLGPVHGGRAARDAVRRAGREPVLSADRRQAARQAGRRGNQQVR